MGGLQALDSRIPRRHEFLNRGINRRRLLTLASAAGLALAACGDAAPSEPIAEPPNASGQAERPHFAAVVPPDTSIAGAASRMQVPPEVIAARQATLVPAASADLQRAREWRIQQWSTNFRIASVALTELRTSDLERYRAEPIEVPVFEDVEEADAFLDPREPVIAFSVGVDARAYPLRFLVWHEVVNDVVDGQPLLVTYDPRTNAAQVFERRLLGSAMRFRALDSLYRGGRLLWDSLTQSWWRQFTGEAIVGDYTGLRLQPRPSLLVSYAEFRRTFPQGRILGPNSRPDRDEESEYGATNYAGYDRGTEGPPFFDGVLDPRLPPTARVLALERNDEAVAFDFSHLADQRVVNDEVAGQPVVALWSPGALSVLDTPRIADARDVGAATVHGREVNGRLLTFEFADGAFRDRETGSVWNLSGRAQSGSLAGAQLPLLVHGSPFWFAWAAFHPQTRLVRHPA